MNKKLLSAIIIATLGLSGCGPTKVNPETYTEVSLQKADLMPTKESLSGKKQKIVIFAPDTSDLELAKISHADVTMVNTLEKYLADVGVEIVDRKIANKLKSELALAESKGKSEYDGPEIANYAISGKISDILLTSSFTERKTRKTKKGKTRVTPAHCDFDATVSANLKLYKLPGLAFAKTIPVTYTKSMQTETTNSKCPISNETAIALIGKAAKKAIKSERTEFQNFFSPKAYVLARKTNGDNNLFKISAGKNFGFIPESTITFYTLSLDKNPITGDVMTEESAIVEGTVTANLIGDKYAWILVEGEEAEKIKLGDYVKVKYEQTTLGSLLGIN
ncbi:hypothetical protein [Psychromonas sp. MME2]|uniref:hypothetical protein n=1 Tax=unclassified Psychromonas TaxID=2614957 RepID=UPI00339BF9FC